MSRLRVVALVAVAASALVITGCAVLAQQGRPPPIIDMHLHPKSRG